MTNRTLITLASLIVSSTALAQQQASATKATKAAEPTRVLGFRPAATPKTHTGKCPVTIKFQSWVHVNHAPAKVEYQWERSDGATGPKQSITIAGNTQYVYDTWELGGAGDHTAVWERVHVLSPNDISSGKAMAQINCSK